MTPVPVFRGGHGTWGFDHPLWFALVMVLCLLALVGVMWWFLDEGKRQRKRRARQAAKMRAAIAEKRSAVLRDGLGGQP